MTQQHHLLVQARYGQRPFPGQKTNVLCFAVFSVFVLNIETVHISEIQESILENMYRHYTKICDSPDSVTLEDITYEKYQ